MFTETLPSFFFFLSKLNQSNADNVCQDRMPRTQAFPPSVRAGKGFAHGCFVVTWGIAKRYLTQGQYAKMSVSDKLG